MITQRRAHAAPPTPFSAFPRLFVPCRDRHKETHKPEVNQPSPITARQPENALMAITTHGGIGTEHNASRPVWRYASNSRRDRTQDIPRGTYDRRRTNARHLDRTARKTFREKRMTGIRQTKNIPREPHNRRDSSAEPHRGNHIADTNGRAIRSIACARFKRNPTARRAGHPHPSADDTFPCGKTRFPPPSEKRIQTNIP